MKFLLIVAVLLINHYWEYRNRFFGEEHWIVRSRRWWRRRMQGLPLAANQGEMLADGLTLLGPVALLGAVQYLLAGLWWGLASAALHLLVMLYCLPRFNLSVLVRDYLAHWREGDYESACRLAEERVPGLFPDRGDSYPLMHRQLFEGLLDTAFRRLFVLVFWYAVVGPPVVLLYFILHRLRVAEGDGSALPEWQRWLVFVLEWPAARLLSLSFALAGDFVSTAGCLRPALTDFRHDACTIVRRCARAALGIDGTTEAGALRSPGGSVERGPPPYPERAAAELAGLHAMLMRSEMIWAAVLAVIVLVV